MISVWARFCLYIILCQTDKQTVGLYLKTPCDSQGVTKERKKRGKERERGGANKRVSYLFKIMTHLAVPHGLSRACLYPRQPLDRGKESEWMGKFYAKTNPEQPKDHKCELWVVHPALDSAPHCTSVKAHCSHFEELKPEI